MPSNSDMANYINDLSMEIADLLQKRLKQDGFDKDQDTITIVTTIGLELYCHMRDVAVSRYPKMLKPIQTAAHARIDRAA